MRVQRTRLMRNYVQISNEIARNNALSLEAVGLLVRLLSLPDGSGATVEKIAALVPNGRRSVSKAMNELIERGYVKRAKVQNPETGRWVTITTVTNTPESPASPNDRFPSVGIPTGQAVGGSPVGSKTEEKKDITPSPLPEPEQQQEAPQGPSEGTEGMGEGERSFLTKINREMTREARRVLVRLSLHEALPLTDKEIERLSPKVLPWIKEGFSSEEILQTLTAALPEQIDSVPGLLSHRLKTRTPERTAAPQAAPKPAQRAQCDVCESPFRLPGQSGTCRNCQAEMDRAAAFHGAAL